MPAARCVLSGAIHGSRSRRSLLPTIKFPKLGCAGVQTGLEVGVRLCSQGTRGNSLRLDTGGKSFVVVRAARAGVESLALEVLARSVQVAPGARGAWAWWGLAAAGTHLGWRPFPNLRIPWGRDVVGSHCQVLGQIVKVQF